MGHGFRFRIPDCSSSNGWTAEYAAGVCLLTTPIFQPDIYNQSKKPSCHGLQDTIVDVNALKHSGNSRTWRRATCEGSTGVRLSSSRMWTGPRIRSVSRGVVGGPQHGRLTLCGDRDYDSGDQVGAWSEPEKTPLAEFETTCIPQALNNFAMRSEFTVKAVVNGFRPRYEAVGECFLSG